MSLSLWNISSNIISILYILGTNIVDLVEQVFVVIVPIKYLGYSMHALWWFLHYEIEC